MRRNAGSWLVFLALAAGAVVAACEADDPAPLDPDDQGPAGQAGSPQGCDPGECLNACQIGGATVARGALDPTNPCAQCDPAVARNAWSPVADGQACGAGRVCAKGACAAGCFLDGELYAAGLANPANACQQCDPARSTLSWSPLADGTACAAGQLCEAGACGAKCFIGGELYAAGATNPANTCQQCNPAASTAAWTALAQGAACDAAKICEAGACQAGCAIDGVFYAADAVNPADACQQCSPAASTTAWSSRGAVPLLAGGLDLESQGWAVFEQTPASLTYGPDYVRVATSTPAGAQTSGALLLAYAGAYDVAKPFTVRVEALVESVTPHNSFDSGAAILGAFTPPFGNGLERGQMVYLDGATLGWADDSQSVAAPAAGEYHTYELSVDADRVARVSVDGVAALRRDNFAPNGTIALGDQTNDQNVDGAMRIRSVTKICP